MKFLLVIFCLSITNVYAIRRGLEKPNNGQHAFIKMANGTCSGVRISSQFILSVAHCFKNISDTALVSFYENSTFITQAIPVSKIIIKGTNTSEELAIIPINSKNTNYIAPKLSFKNRLKNNDTFSIWGFGLTLDGISGKLHKGYLNFKGNYQPAGRENMLVMSPGSSDQIPCAGDSGGALFSVKGKKLIGIVSFINHSFKSLKGKTAKEKCSMANGAYFVQLNKHLPFLSPYLDATNRP